MQGFGVLGLGFRFKLVPPVGTCGFLLQGLGIWVLSLGFRTWAVWIDGFCLGLGFGMDSLCVFDCRILGLG